MKTNLIVLSDAMQDADFVQLNGIVFEAGYLRLPDESTDCPLCRHALAHALITERSLIPAETLKKLAPLVGKYIS